MDTKKYCNVKKKTKFIVQSYKKKMLEKMISNYTTQKIWILIGWHPNHCPSLAAWLLRVKTFNRAFVHQPF